MAKKFRTALKYILFPVIALILEVSPYGAVIVSGNLNESSLFYRIHTYCSSFNITLLGLGSYAPFVTTILTISIIITAITSIIREKLNARKALEIMTGLAIILSLIPAAFFAYSMVNALAHYHTDS